MSRQPVIKIKIEFQNSGKTSELFSLSPSSTAPIGRHEMALSSVLFQNWNCGEAELVCLKPRTTWSVAQLRGRNKDTKIHREEASKK